MPDNFPEIWLNPLSSAQSFLCPTNQVSFPGACSRPPDGSALTASWAPGHPARCRSHGARPAGLRGYLELVSCRQVHLWCLCVCQQGRGNLRKGPKGVLKGATLLKNEGVFLTWNCIFVYFQVPMFLSSYLNLMARWCTARQVKSTGATAVQWRGGCRRWRRNGKIFPPPVSAGTWYREICEHGEPVVERAFSFT